MSDHDSKLERSAVTASTKPKATEEQISRMSGIATVPDDGRDGRGRAMTIHRRRWLQDGSLGEPEVWMRVDKEFFERT
jgi:hypothetical protein